MTDDELYQFLEGDHQLFGKTLPDGRYVAVIPLTFGRARIVRAKSYEQWRSEGYDEGW